MDFFPHQFLARIDSHDFGRMAYACVYLPAEVASALPQSGKGRHRIVGELGGRPLEAGLNPSGDGRLYVIVSADTLRALGLAVGDTAPMAFRLGDPDAVEMPAALEAALHAEPDLAAVWESLSPGVRRGFAHRVSSAKREDTRARRVAEVMAALESPDPSPYRRRSSRVPDA